MAICICYVSHASAHYTHHYLEYFAGRGHEVHLVHCDEADAPHAINHHLVRGPFDPHRANLIYFRLIPSLRRVLKRIRPDIVHAHYVTSFGFMAAVAGVHPLAISAMGSDIHDGLTHPLKKWLVRYALRRADLINAISKELEQKILGTGVPAGRLMYLTHGVDTARFAAGPRERTGQVGRIICTRKLFPVYDPETIVQALALIAERGTAFEFIFAASGPLEGALRSQVAAAGLGDCVRFRGGYSPSELPDLLANADVYVSASRWDGTSPALLEAMAAGLWPVVTAIPANREWVTGEGDGSLVPVGDVAALADALAMALANDEARRLARPILRQRVRADGDRSTNLARLEQRYHELLTTRRG